MGDGCRQRWIPERIFYSHATSDTEITSKIREAIKFMKPEYELFVSEHKISGTSLLPYLREEMLSCNGILVAWTRDCNKKKTSQIISFEVGMAYSLGMPIYLLKSDNTKMPWFFDHVTKHDKLDTSNLNQLVTQLRQLLDLSNFLHPIDVIFKKEFYPDEKKAPDHSQNMTVIQEDGSFILPRKFRGILHYYVENRRNKPEKSVRITLIFPPNYCLDFTPGSLDFRDNEKTHRTDLFYCFWHGPNIVTLHWISLPPGETLFEIKVICRGEPIDNEDIIIQCSSESLINVRKKFIPLSQV